MSGAPVMPASADRSISPRDAHARSVLDFLSAAYAAMGLYDADHPLVLTLAESAHEALDRLLAHGGGGASVSAAIEPTAFRVGGVLTPHGHVSGLAGDLHDAGMTGLTLRGPAGAGALRGWLSVVRETTRARAEANEIVDRAESPAAGAITLTPVPVGAIASGAAAAGDGAPAALVSEADFTALHRRAGGDPAAFAAALSAQIESPGEGADAARGWLLSQLRSMGGALGCSDEDSRRAWLAGCVEQLSPAARRGLLGAVNTPDPEWFLAASRLAPIWPMHELVDALENVAASAATLRGTARLLFTQLWHLTQRSHDRDRLAALAAQWHARAAAADHGAIPTAGMTADPAGEPFRAADYAEELTRLAGLAGTGAGRPGAWDFGVIEDEEVASVLAADIALAVTESKHDMDRAAGLIARSAESLIRNGRLDLIVDVMLREHPWGEPGEAAQDAARSVRQRRLVSALQQPECVDALLDQLERATDDPSTLRLLDISGEHAAPRVLSFCATTPSDRARERALAWFCGLAPDTQAAAVGEHLSVSPMAGAVLAAACAQIPAATLARHVPHLLDGARAEHAVAAYVAMGAAPGEWPASLVDAVLRETRPGVLAAGIAAACADASGQRCETLGRLLGGLVLLRRADTAAVAPLIGALAAHRSPIAERALLEILAALRGRASEHADAIAAGLSGRPDLSDHGRMVLRRRRSTPSWVSRLSRGVSRRAG
jgi:hypothetical protein